MSQEAKTNKSLSFLQRFQQVETGVYNLIDKLPEQIKGELLPVHTGLVPMQGENFCLVCGMRRLNPDPTGVTCGNEECLKEVGKLAKEGWDLEGYGKAVSEVDNILHLICVRMDLREKEGHEEDPDEFVKMAEEIQGNFEKIEDILDGLEGELFIDKNATQYD